MLLSEEEINRLMEENRKSQSKPTQIHSASLKKGQKQFNGKKINDAGTIVCPHQTNK